MQTFISILRGINVSGHRKIDMAGLKGLYEELQLEEVISYIQSGNVVFKASKKTRGTQLAKTIEKAIFQKYGFEVPVIVRTVMEMENVLSANPFLEESDIDVEKLHITFLSDVPATNELQKIEGINHPPDRFIIKEKDVYLYCPRGYGNTKLSNNFFENKLKVTATTRNWKTANKLLELASAI